MKQVDSYKITWNAKVDEGVILLHTTDGGLEQVHVDSAPEASLILHGFEAVGQGEDDA